jgi:phosphoenolpyruvate---glycerone phosphotransferase subunit DhaL
MESLNTEQARVLVIAALQALAQKASYLNELDRASGDGDHGTTLSRGASSAIRELESTNLATVNEVFVIAGKAMMKSMGGASGVLYGTFFRAAQDEAPALRLDRVTLGRLFGCGVRSIRQKTKADVGDKTMLDALVPALKAVEESDSDSTATVLDAAAGAAEKGARSTIGMVAKFGRAKTIGGRAAATMDPGACSVALLFRALAQAARELD